jgi:1-acyl-sn-glycerol-3-phosphate acyltransferase
MKRSTRFVELLFRNFFKCLIRLEVRGRENVPATGGVIIAANHFSLADPPLIMLALRPRPSHFLAKEELFQSAFFRFLMNLGEAIPVSRNPTLSQAEQVVQVSVETLNNGGVLGLFPEGHRSQNAKLGGGYRGVAMIALRSEAPIVPVGICGTEKLKGWGLIKRPRVHISFGEPFRPPDAGNVSKKAKLDAMTSMVMERIGQQLPPEHR